MADALAIRKKLYEDFEFYSKHCIQIRTKEGTIVPLVLNQVQKRFVHMVLRQIQTRGRVRMVVLKARQQGLSTVITALHYWWLSQHRAQKGLVMAHEAESTTALFDMYKRIHDNCPDFVKPETKYSSRTELVFSKLDSGLRVATAGGRGVARGETLTFAHLSEVAFWPTAFAQTNFNGLIQAIPETDGTFVFVESTAQGVVGKFADLWQNAIEMGYEQFFSAWFESDEYRDEDVPNDFKLTPDEASLAEQYSLDSEQLFWRRRKIAANGAALFKQEYPATPDEAFISTGRPVFNTEYVMDRLREPVKPKAQRLVTDGVIDDNPRGELAVYHEVDPARSYFIGADVSVGVAHGDYSVAQVLDDKLRQVATWRGHVHPDYFAKILATLGYHYNSAMICPERNNHGLLTCVRLRDLDYPYLWTDTTEGQLEERDSINIGFFTSERTKPLVINKLRALDREREIEINDTTTLREMNTFVVTESGKMQAEEPAFDDTVMALALASHIAEKEWEIHTTPDKYYTEAI